VILSGFLDVTEAAGVGLVERATCTDDVDEDDGGNGVDAGVNRRVINAPSSVESCC